MLRERAQANRGPTLILVESDRAAVLDIPELELERLAALDHEQLRDRVQRLADALELERPACAAMLRDAADHIASAGRGLTLQRFDRLLGAASLVEAATPASIAAALHHRRIADACGPMLARVEPVSASELVGFDRYLAWLRERALSFDPAAGQAGLRSTGKVALVGIPGCGHRLAARVTASVLGLPLLRVDLAGAAEPSFPSFPSFPSIMAALEAAAPVVIWIDERDTRAEHLNELANQLSQRLPGVFVVATATRPKGLPSPWRCGHGLDELFFVDLPDVETRAQLLAKLLARVVEVGRAAPPTADPLTQLQELARAAEGCSGADLAHALTDARLRCFARGRPLRAADLEAALATRSRMAEREPQRIEALRAWAKPLARAVDHD
jgi:hypothetical protein